MSTSREKLVDDIFCEALDLDPGAREELLARRCGGDDLLRREVGELLAAADETDDPVADRIAGLRDRFVRDAFGSEAVDGEDLSGQRVGAWRIERRVARGGLATVYLANREDGEFEQRVALKVLRRGLDTDDLIARFRAERQILSTLDHPAIAQILDGGALEDGRPYLVMEYVDGLPITLHCQQRDLGVRDRVVLMIAVLRALHHAHQHLVVHRDVKPSNILVTPDGNVSLLDFGIAKILDPASMPGGSTLTRTGVSLLTPGYGSPEQRAGEPVTTASDIYQAGLVFYELLAGERAILDHRDADAGTSALVPSKPLRGAPSFRQVRGDLDAIVRKATHGDPALRYASADEMVSDLQRYLDGLPVSARPDTLAYRFSKLTRRRPWLMPLVALSLVAVVAYVTTLTVYSRRLLHEEQLAGASQQFLIELLRSPDPFAPADARAGSSITVLQALEAGRERIRHELADQPELRAAVLGAVAEVYESLDDDEEAIELRQEALALERGLYGDRSPQVVASKRALGQLFGAAGRLDEAGRLLEEQLTAARAMFGAKDPELGLAELAVGVHESRLGNLARSQALISSGLDRLRSTRTEHAREIIGALLVSAEHHGMESHDQAYEAVGAAEQVAREAFGESSLQVANVRIRLASTMTMFGDYEESEANFLKAIPVLESQLGIDHGSTISALNNLGYLYARSGRLEEAERIQRDVMQRQIARRGTVHRDVADSYQNLGGTLSKLGRFDEAIPLLRRAYETYKATVNPDNYIIAFPLLTLSYSELMRGDGAAAQAAAEEAGRRFESSVPGTYLEGVARCLAGLALEKQGRTREGGALVAASHPLMQTGSIPEPYPSLCRLPQR